MDVYVIKFETITLAYATYYRVEDKVCSGTIFGVFTELMYHAAVF
jgi:hypothetical protein